MWPVSLSPPSGQPLREDITDGWKKREENAEKKEYVEFKTKSSIA